MPCRQEGTGALPPELTQLVAFLASQESALEFPEAGCREHMTCDSFREVRFIESITLGIEFRSVARQDMTARREAKFTAI